LLHPVNSNLIAGSWRPVPLLDVKSYVSAVEETEIALALGKTTEASRRMSPS